MKFRFLVALILGLTMLFGVLAFVPNTAHAATARPAVSCSGTGCNGKQASQTGCNNGDYQVGSTATVHNPFNDPIATVQLYWSPTCKTNWVHYHNTYDLNSEASTTDCVNGNTEESPYTYSGAFDSPMYYAPNDGVQGVGESYSDGNWEYGYTTCG